MSVTQSGPDKIVVAGEIGEATHVAFEEALDVLRSSETTTPVIDLQDVTYISSKGIGMLVALWVDLSDRGRWFDLYASDKVWTTLEKAGVARVFFQRPK
jgi:anti-anti-sigma factor